MYEITGLLLLLVLIATVGGILKSNRRRIFKYSPKEEWPFEKKKLMTAPEQLLYSRLIESLPNLCIFSQVQLSQLVSVKKGHDFKQWFNRISRMSADFVVTDKAMEIIAVIELDDRTHNKPDRIEADKKKDKALTSAGIKVIRWKVSPMPTVAQIKEAFSLNEKIAPPIQINRERKKEAPTIEQLRKANVDAGKPANSGLKWSLIESEELIALYAEKKSIKELAAQFERSELAIMAQLEKLSPIKKEELAKTSD
ncbi:DUF2726 domain-containing protein [Cellvibrio sp. UBA7661]|uniref:DUF2726 domain-containing protein n=1 Tax=Cellvibrio sp. UBA7661 TaxID=1946311 RepID=UPI002F3509EA